MLHTQQTKIETKQQFLLPQQPLYLCASSLDLIPDSLDIPMKRQQSHPDFLSLLLAAMQRIPEREEILIVLVDEVQQLPAEQLVQVAQFLAQVLEALVAVSKGGEVLGWVEVGGEE